MFVFCILLDRVASAGERLGYHSRSWCRQVYTRSTCMSYILLMRSRYVVHVIGAQWFLCRLKKYDTPFVRCICAFNFGKKWDDQICVLLDVYRVVCTRSEKSSLFCIFLLAPCLAKHGRQWASNLRVCQPCVCWCFLSLGVYNTKGFIEGTCNWVRKLNSMLWFSLSVSLRMIHELWMINIWWLNSSLLFCCIFRCVSTLTNFFLNHVIRF